MIDKKNMEAAFELARRAADEGEVPVGAVIVHKGEIIACGYNKREKDKNALGHAEIEAIDKACKALSSWRLSDCELYVTLEPCPMCAGAIINARLGRVIFSAYDEKSGCFGSAADFNQTGFNHKVAIVGGYMENEGKKLLEEFFAGKR